MRTRFHFFPVLICLAALPPALGAGLLTPPQAVRADESQKAPEPTVIVYLRSIETLFEDTVYWAKASGKEAEARELKEKMEPILTGAMGASPFDLKKPIGAYVAVAEPITDSDIVLLLPVGDEKTFMNLFTMLDVKLTKEKDGSYSFPIQGFPFLEKAFLRIADGYAYFSPTRNTVGKAKLIKPADVLKTTNTRLYSAVVRLDSLSPQTMDFLVKGLEESFEEFRQSHKTMNSPAQRKAWEAYTDHTLRWLKMMLTDGREVGLHLGTDRRTDELALELSLTPKAKSKLEQALAEIGNIKTPLAGLLTDDPGLQVLFNIPFPDDLRQAMADSFGELVREQEKKGDKPKTKEQEVMMAQLQKIFSPMMGHLNFFESFTAIRGPNSKGKYLSLIAAKYTGPSVEKEIREVVQSMKPEDRSLVHLDAEKVGNIRFHRFDSPEHADGKFQQWLGKEPVWFAMSSDAMFYAAGEGGLAALKKAVQTPARPAPQLQFELSLGSLWPMFNKEKAEATLRKIGPGKNPDKIGFTIEGGQAFTVRLGCNAQAFRLIEAMNNGDEDKKPEKTPRK
jgi:hypothetical protein